MGGEEGEIWEGGRGERGRGLNSKRIRKKEIRCKSLVVGNYVQLPKKNWAALPTLANKISLTGRK